MISIKKSTQSGFSLMELMIALAVLGLIMAAVGPALMNRYKSARKKTAITSVKMIHGAVETFELDLGKIPQRLNDLIKRPATNDYYDQEMVSNWQDGGYIKGGKIPRDPWKNKFKYNLTPNSTNRYELYSYGPNGKGSPKSEWIKGR